MASRGPEGAIKWTCDSGEGQQRASSAIPEGRKSNNG